MPRGLDRWWQGLKRTRERVETGWRRLVGLKVTPEFWDGLEETLYQADLGPVTVEALLTRLRDRIRSDRPFTEPALQDLLAEEMVRLLPPDVADPWRLPSTRPQVWVVLGVNGSGKTTSAGKLAAQFHRRGHSVLLGAADTFRAAAAEQLTAWGERAGVPVLQQGPGADPAAVAFDTAQAARNRGIDLAVIDTAGRLHTKTPLMQELGKVVRVLDRACPGAPHETLLVLDATMGQNAIRQAELFQGVGATGIILTKLDGTAKGGMVLAIHEQLNLPVRWIGLGETADDLEPFQRDAFVSALLGRDGDR